MARAAPSPLRYYEYVSDVKLDFLSGQVPEKLLSRLAAELKVDLKVISATISTVPNQTSRYDKLRVLEKYLERNEDIGDVADPALWFRGDLRLRSQVFGGLGTGLLLYVGAEGGTLVALIGSAHHLIGSGTEAPRSGIGYSGSSLPALFGVLRKDDAEWSERLVLAESNYPLPAREPPGDQAALAEVVSWMSGLHGLPQSREFLARRLLRGTVTGRFGEPFDVVIGTPLYVALSNHD